MSINVLLILTLVTKLISLVSLASFFGAYYAARMDIAILVLGVSVLCWFASAFLAYLADRKMMAIHIARLVAKQNVLDAIDIEEEAEPIPLTQRKHPLFDFNDENENND